MTSGKLSNDLAPLVTESLQFRWNFEKFLLDHNGQPVRRYDESLDPSEIIPDIDALMDNIPQEDDNEDGANDEITTMGPSQ